MGRRGLAVLASVAWFATISCGERQEARLAAPLADITGSELGCSFSSLSTLSASYFRNNGAFRETASGLILQMQTAGAGTTTARNKGFDLLVLISKTVTAGNGGPVADGSALANRALACMFNSTAELPATFPEDFTAAIDPAIHGAFEVRGGATDPATAPVYARPGVPNTFTGIAPPSGVTWPAMLSGIPAPSRLLVYGKPGSTADSYDWKMVPRNGTFSPAAIVGLCVDPNTSTTSMLQEEHVGLLIFADAYFLDPAWCSPVAFRAWNPLEFAGRLFGVKPLVAAVVNPGGLGGSTGGLSSEFQAHDLQAPSGGQTGGVVLTFVTQPADVRTNQTFPVITISATSNGVPVGGVEIHVVSVTNNGVPAFLAGTVTLTTSNTGVVTFSDLSQVKTGGYRLVATGAVVGRPAITVTGATSDKFNVRPAK